MSKETYSIPRGVTARFDFQRNVIDLSIAHAPAWNIPAAKLTAIAPLRTDYELKYAIAANRNTQSVAATTARDAAWDVLETAIADLYDQELINNSAIADADKQALYIHFSTGGGTSTPAQVSTPVVTLVAEEISVLHVVYADSANPGTHYKPANVAFCEVWAKIGDPAPTDPSGCTEHYNVSRSHEAIVFEAAQRGKTLYGYARWVNKNGKTGPWSGLFTAIIP